jgi:Vam6/Vps39-like protein vacuolar protein sorting-associated protein 39
VHIGFVKPYVFSIFPPNTLPSASTNDSSVSVGSSTIAAPSVQILSSLSLNTVQLCSYPFSAQESAAGGSAGSYVAENYTIRLLASSLGSRPFMLTVSTPTDKVALTTEGSTIWLFRMQTWAAQVDELVQAGAYESALSLLNSIDDSFLPDKAGVSGHMTSSGLLTS